MNGKKLLSQWKTIVVHYDDANQNISYELNDKERLKNKILPKKRRSLKINLIANSNLNDNKVTNHMEGNNSFINISIHNTALLSISEPFVYQYSNIQEIQENPK